jgi:AraC-like DNA-binding protein
MASAFITTLREDQVPEQGAVATRSHEPADLQRQWASFVTENLCKFSIQTPRETTFGINARTRSKSGFVVARFTTVAGRAQLERTAAEIRADSRDSYAVYIPVHGVQEIRQLNRDSVCSPESLTLVSLSEPYRQIKLGDNDTLYLLIPRRFVDERVIHGEDICSRPVCAQAGMGRLAADTVAALGREAAKLNDADFLGAARAAGDLVLLALAGAADVMSNVRSVRASNLARAKRIIRARLEDADLSLSDIARECGLSLRYLHDLFRDDECTVREYLHGERLRLARHMLERAPAGTAAVTDICMRCGFSNPSQFSTAFRRAFGVSPRDVLRHS